MSFLTGKKSKQTSESGNKAYPWIMDNFGSSGASAFNSGTSALSGLLGLGGDPAASKAALDNWWGSSGGQFLMDQGVDQVNSNFYARGLGNSGAAMKGMEEFRQGLASTKLNEMLRNLMGFSQLGLGAGNLVANAGQYSKGTGTGGTQGLGALIGSALAFASDRSLKADIKELGDWDRRGDGLKKYAFRYKSDKTGTRRIGVMADEVKRLRPWAYIPNFTSEGKPGVNYALLGMKEPIQ